MDELGYVINDTEEVEEVSTDSETNEVETEEDFSLNDAIADAFKEEGFDNVDNNDSQEVDQQNENEDEGKEVENTDAKKSMTDNKQSKDQTTYELKRQGEKKIVTLDEMKALAQQHWDYPHVKAERDLAKAKVSFYEQTFENSRGEWGDIWGLIDDCNAQSLIKNEAENGRTMSYKDAVDKVKANREALFSPKTITELEKEDFEGVKNTDIALLQKCFPDVDFNKDGSISEDVWSNFKNNGGNLTASYMQSIIASKDAEIASLKRDLESVEQNVKNKLRSSGSSKSSGAKQTTINDAIKSAFTDELY